MGQSRDTVQQVEEAVAGANIPCLLMTLVHLTGDTSWLDDRFTIARIRGMQDDETGGLPEPVQAEVRAAAADAIQLWRAGEPAVLPVPPPDLIVRMLSRSMGEPIPQEYAPMLLDEFLHATADSFTVEPVTGLPEEFEILIVGAGFSGLCAGALLGAAGVRCSIVERSDEVGGVWLENRYPGAGVDTPSLLYSYGFQPYDWPHHFATRDEVKAYLEHVSDAFDLRSRIRFGTEVVRATYDDAGQSWTVELRTPRGTEQVRADIVISAVGAFNPPAIPHLPGLESFEGRWFHTARWPDDVDLRGTRVTVIGNGASAMQIVPAIVDDVAALTIFQRAPQWAQPFPLFKKEIPTGARQLLRDVPWYRAWNRLRLGWIFHDKLHGALQKDAAWEHPDRAINAVNDGHRQYLTNYIRAELGDRTDLAEVLVPDYPPFGKRMLMDNGWFRTLTREHVRLVTHGIAEVIPGGIVTTSGEEIPADVIVMATGFDVVRFISTFEVVGREGRSLRETWDDDDGRAYLGLAVPGFPNFFCLYGPNTQPGHGGSLVATVEAQMNYILDLLRAIGARAIGAVECRRDMYERYAAMVDDAHDRMIWTHPGMTTYYRNSRGRVVVNSPFRNLDFWKMTRRARLEDFVVEQRRESLEAIR